MGEKEAEGLLTGLALPWDRVSCLVQSGMPRQSVCASYLHLSVHFACGNSI